jgi:hypothetical protein
MTGFSEQAYSKSYALQKLSAKKEPTQSSGDGFADRGRR